MLLSGMGACSWKGASTLRRQVRMGRGCGRAPGLRPAGRVPSLSNQPHGADDCVDPAGGGGEGGTGPARPFTSSSLQNALISIC